MITVDWYAAAIQLHGPFVPLLPPLGVGELEARRETLEWLLADGGKAIDSMPADVEAEVLIRTLLTVRRPGRRRRPSAIGGWVLRKRRLCSMRRWR